MRTWRKQNCDLCGKWRWSYAWRSMWKGPHYLTVCHRHEQVVP